MLERLWDTLAANPTGQEARPLEVLLEVPEGSRTSDLERLRTSPTTVSGKALTAALGRAAEIGALGLGDADLSGVPRRRVVELARYSMAGKAPALRRRPDQRRLATLLATVVYLEAKAVDDALDLFDVLMTNDLLARANRESRDEKARRYPAVSRDAGKLAAAIAVLLAAHGQGPRAPVTGMVDSAAMQSLLAATSLEVGLLGRIAVAFALGFALGFERELRGAPAGDRTYALVGTAAAAVTAVCIDRSPQAVAGVLTGIGFIGAGMVFRGRGGMLTGVTSAATLLGVVAIGVVAGAGHLMLAVAVAALILVDLEIRYVPVLRILDGRRYTSRMKADEDMPDQATPGDRPPPA